jgi:hypothetical protein
MIKKIDIDAYDIFVCCGSFFSYDREDIIDDGSCRDCRFIYVFCPICNNRVELA